MRTSNVSGRRDRDSPASLLDVDAANRASAIASLDDVLIDEPPDVLLIDDLEVWAGGHLEAALRRLRAYAREACTGVVVTVPDDVATDGRRPRGLWARLPDLLLGMQQPGMLPADLQGIGKVDFAVWKRGARPVATLRFGFQGHYVRLVERPDVIEAAH